MAEPFDPEPETDLNPNVQAALDFLFRRIEEQASRSGITLGEDARYFLEMPPISQGPTVPSIYSMPLPRNREFEQVFELMKKAYSFDRSADGEFEREWKRSYAIMRLNNQSATATLLKAAGVKVEDSFKDGLLLFIGGLAVVIGALGISIEGALDRWALPIQILVAFCAASALLVFFQSRGVSKKYWKSQVERLSRPN